MAARRRGWVWLFAGLVFALLAALVAMAAVEVRVQQQTAATPKAEATVSEAVAPVVVAAKHIPMTHAIAEGDVNLQEWPVDIIPEGAATDLEAVMGSIVMNDVYAGEPLMTARLANPDVTGENIAFTMPEGSVVFALPADDLMSDIELLQPGDTVDILFSLKPEADQKAAGTGSADTGEPELLGDPLFTTDALQAQSITAIIMDTSLVQSGESEVQADDAESAGEAVASITAQDQGEPKAILLALDPQDALILKYFRDAGGMMDIVLRRRGSTELLDVETVNYDYIKDLYGIPERQSLLGQ